MACTLRIRRRPVKPSEKESPLDYEKLPSEPRKSHKRRKTCVRCNTVWEIVWYDREAFKEMILCPNCRPKKST